jgi:signal peptidase I
MLRVGKDREMHAAIRRAGPKDQFVIPFKGFSMYPLLKPGDLLVMRSLPSHSFKVGDVILFESGLPDHFEGLIAHRVIRIRPNRRILTKGDNLPRPDPELEDGSRILGQVISVLRGDRMISLTKGPLGFAAKWIAFLSRKNVTPGILAAKMKGLKRKSR